MEYQNFRLYIRDFYSEQKSRFGFTWRDFAKSSGYSSPVFLKLVCDGKANLSEVGVERVAIAMGLIGVDLDYFRELVSFNQEKCSKKKKEFFSKMRALAKKNSVTLLGEEQYDYFGSWRNPVIRELAPFMSNESSAKIANQFAFDTSAKEVNKAIALLQKVGLLEKDSEGNFKQANHNVSTGNLESVSLSVRDMHRQMGELAVRALDEIPVKERDISGQTLGLSEEGFYKISKEIEAFRRRIAAIALEDVSVNKVYRLNVQLFPLTKGFKEGGENV